MKPPIFQRYLITLNRYKWLAAASFIACVGVAGAIASQTEPIPKFIAVGALTSNRPSVTFSNTANAIVEQGKQLAVEELLADNVIKAVSDRIKESPEQIRKNALLKPPSPQKPAILQVLYRNDDAKKAASGAEALMLAMVEKSRLINTARLKGITEEIYLRLPKIKKDLDTATQKLNQSNEGNEQERSRLQQDVTNKKALSDKMLAALNDARAAEAEIVSSLAIAQPPQVASMSGLNPFFTTLVMGILAGILVGGGLILMLALISKYPNPSEIRQKLLSAYKGKCAITGCEIDNALETLCIDAYRNFPLDDISNWLILRADIQKLFDAQLLAIEPATLTVRLAPEIATSSYSKLAGLRLQLPEDEDSRPNIDALESRYRQCRWIEDEGVEKPVKA